MSSHLRIGSSHLCQPTNVRATFLSLELRALRKGTAKSEKRPMEKISFSVPRGGGVDGGDSMFFFNWQTQI